MKSMLSFITALFLTALVFTGCGKEKAEVTAPEQSDNFIISPADQAQDVRLDSKIILTFAKPVDAQIVENGFHLISQKDMADSTCRFSKTMQHGEMNMAMMDTMKMNHLDLNHSVKGTFYWNSTNTQCVFTPDSMMTSNMLYMVHIGKNMIDMMNQKMGEMGSMMGGSMMSGTGQMSGHMLMHFTTMDTTSTGGGGHLGHH